MAESSSHNDKKGEDRVELNYSILDDSSELIIGYCKSIEGLDGNIFNDGDFFYHKIKLLGFVFNMEFKKYLIKTKESIGRLAYICILNKEKNSIGKIPFTIYDDIYYHKIGFPDKVTDITWRGSLWEVVSDKETEIWNKWRITYPVQKNEWSSLSKDSRRAWLKVVKNYNSNNSNYSEIEENSFCLDGTYITDYSSFFCALGEAMNGPGGYYGFDLNSLVDCFCGGFGAKAPFTLLWENHQVGKKYLDKNCWVEEINYKRILENKLLDYSGFEEKGDRPLFEALIENIQNNGVTVLLN